MWQLIRWLIIGRRAPVVADNNKAPKTVEQPENAIVKILRQAVPYVAGLDYTVIAIIVVKLCMTLFVPVVAKALIDGGGVWFFEVFPTGGVLITGTLAAGLITSRLSSLETDIADIPTIRDANAQKERREFLYGQIKVCKDQRKQAIFFIIVYVVLVSAPTVVGIDITNPLGRGILLGLIVGEMLVPLLNMRTFSIVESSMIKIDVVSNVMYQAAFAAQQVLAGIGSRAQSDTLSSQDRRALRRGRKGDIDGMLAQRQTNNYALMEGEQYNSLRSVITGVKDGEPLNEDQEARYKKALAIARKYRQSEDQEQLQHFTRGPHNQLFVSREMAGIIAAAITRVRSRNRPRKAA